MNQKEELKYLRKVCEAAKLCAVCKHFAKSIDVEGKCDLQCGSLYAYSSCAFKRLGRQYSRWERRPARWESETCGTCIKCISVFFGGIWIKRCDVSQKTVNREQKACPEWEATIDATNNSDR